MVGKGEKEMAKKEEVLPVVEKPADQVSLPSNTGKAVVEGETADKESVAEKPSTTVKRNLQYLERVKSLHQFQSRRRRRRRREAPAQTRS